MACLLGSFFLWGFGGVNEHVLWALVALSIAYMNLNGRKSDIGEMGKQ
jgi:hypothetical protein